MAQIPLQGRQQVDNRDLYGYTTPRVDPAAKPTDSYIQPSLSPDTMGLLEALRAMNEAAPTVGAAWVGRKQEETKEGSLERFKQKDDPNAKLDPAKMKQWAFVKGWEQADGKLTAATMYGNELSALHERIKDTATPEEYMNEVAKVSKRYLNGASEDWATGFLPGAVEMDEKYLALYQDELNATYKKKQFQTANASMSVDFSKLLSNELATQLGVNPLTFDINAFRKDPKAYLLFKDNKEAQDKLSTILRTASRQALTTYQTAYGSYLRKDEVSAMYLDIVGQNASHYGLPEALDFVFEKDEHKVAVFDTELQAKAREYKEAAERAREKLGKAHEDQNSEDRKMNVSKGISTYELRQHEVLAMTNRVDQVTAANQLIADMKADSSIKDGTYESIRPGWFTGFLTDVEKLSEQPVVFALKNNESVVFNLDNKMRYKILTGSEINAAAGSLTEPTWRSYNQAYMQQENDLNQLGNSGSNKELTESGQSIDRVRAAMVRVFTTDELALDKWPGIGMAVLHRVSTSEQSWRKKHGRLPLYDEWYKDVVTPILTDFENQYKKLYGEDPQLLGRLGLAPLTLSKSTEGQANKNNQPPPVLDNKTSFAAVTQLFNQGHDRQTIINDLVKLGNNEDTVKHYLTNFGLQQTDALISKGKASVKTFDQIAGDVEKDLTNKGFTATEIRYYLNTKIRAWQGSGSTWDFDTWKGSKQKGNKKKK